MKLKKFNQMYLENHNFNSLNYTRKNEAIDEEEEEPDEFDDLDIPQDFNPEEEPSEDDMSHLCYLLRQMFSNIGMEDVYVENSDLDVSISVYFNRKESLKDIIKVFNVVKKIKKDILAQYEDSFEIWETKKSGQPAITFDFVYDDGLTHDTKGSKTPDKDSNIWSVLSSKLF